MLIAFSESKGYSVRNLKYMAKFAETYPDREFVQQVVAQIPWGHNIVLLDKVADMDERKWYIKKSAEISKFSWYFKRYLIVDTTLHSIQLLIMRIIPSINDRFVLISLDFPLLNQSLFLCTDAF